MHDVFLSYSSCDKGVAFTICQRLGESGVKGWIIDRDIETTTIPMAMEDSKIFVLILSKSANNSIFVLGELKLAFHHHVPKILFRIEDIEPKRRFICYLNQWEWIDAFHEPKSEYFNELIQKIKELLNR
jgi:hypothetical protein